MDCCYTSHHGFQSSERERLFEKPLTPSDVGKLNRLVIPKQHAERYFPLAGTTSNITEPGEKGLLLGFEDESGKSWRFRYSYWTSSQSYVLTKGWSRFVKEKQLDAGDIVLFERNTHGDRFFIGCRRRSEQAAAAAVDDAIPAARNTGCSWPQEYFYSPGSSASSTYTYYNVQQDHCQLHAGGTVRGGVVAAAAAAAAAPATSKTLRLFGVNLECGPDHY